MVAENKAAKPFNAADAVKLAETATANFEERDENGFLIVNDKSKLTGKAFTIVHTEYDVKDTLDGGIDRVHVYAVLDAGKTPVHFMDASSGVYRQLSEYKGTFPVRVARGLRVSNYNTQNGPASTYYLDFEVRS